MPHTLASILSIHLCARICDDYVPCWCLFPGFCCETLWWIGPRNNVYICVSQNRVLANTVFCTSSLDCSSEVHVSKLAGSPHIGYHYDDEEKSLLFVSATSTLYTFRVGLTWTDEKTLLSLSPIQFACSCTLDYPWEIFPQNILQNSQHLVNLLNSVG